MKLQVILIFFLIAGIGCNRNNIEKQADLIQEETSQVVTTDEVMDHKFELNDYFVHDLVNDAFERRWRVEVADYNEDEGSTFEKDGFFYRFYSDDINNQEEMEAYLGEVYTIERVKEITQNITKFIKDGKLYHQDGEMGTLMQWKRSTVQLIRSTDDKKIYQFRVPEADEQIIERNIELIKTSIGWRVNTLIEY